MGVNCFVPKTLKEALEIKRDHDCIVMAGGSDLMVSAFRATGVTPEFENDVLLVRSLSELRGIEKNLRGETVIKACTTSREIASSPLVPWCLRQAASKMGAVALRNSATIGGNIANASPKGDMPGPLYLYDARVVLESAERGEREMPIADFVLSLKHVALQKDEIITKIIIPYDDTIFSNLFYHKIGRRKANAISKLTLCSAISFTLTDTVKDFRLATTACGVKTNRSRAVESIVIGHKRTELPFITDQVTNSFLDLLTPRAMPEYRKKSTANMVTDFLVDVASGNAPRYIC